MPFQHSGICGLYHPLEYEELERMRLRALVALHNDVADCIYMRCVGGMRLRAMYETLERIRDIVGPM